jgi:hypothetical protein
MRLRKTLARLIALALTPALLCCFTAQSVTAAMVSTARVANQAHDTGSRERVGAFLERADVQQVMERWGVHPEEAKARVAALTDAEIADIASHLDSLPAGAGGSVVGPIVGAIVLIFLVLLVTDLLGLTDVFPFVKKKRSS